ncbi:hypothetical protein A3H10_05230 [Candidatus Uhrbacteria bacterium RIFCSPLOWO2_12_FULL_46_10]|uniref:Thioredoxin domain-containing protein n=1 Tax=Candidatus Uhrbacteria bacterium RIFCSPLOWO2_01_FULL_47_25 TaxID=1802402 RepID=A0A1F7UY50_9BACT|nr:MAG: Periplasmic thiol:disulfide interchange protein DsbA [Parcubacteria group bacterium GW2011_GWA2_46_9]OGL60103.1 MAG: hypothetical protein A2752_03800 [Candidatus Uhrbacteria bacterium RIFCSPHIGHO2_01_FULL_46_23]OGL69740.1 MAG: hypothetical protein A3D60_05175 [Candidatus Uhrbacteria bacterium RIFCSPHIGHO2_02_FULL_47_29]OGL76570.1 MAG: hypothetical protein A3E96_04155 [Candidatus Uhrbacteria bacterium RIFCSPHIGHO2_12_FULL_46_13]OGL83195.1 MAG: hypothetical protein A2936_04640 [Candidatus
MEQPVVSFKAPRWWQRWWWRALIAVGVVVLLFFGYVAILVSRNPPDISKYRDRFTSSGMGARVAVDLSILIRDGDPTLGLENAPVTIVEFGDFECPYCREAYPVIRTLAAEFGNRVRVIYRHFPVPEIHEQAVAAAEASMCANEQGKFWPYHDRLFQNQPRFDKDSLQQYAMQVGLDIEKFNTCFNSRQYKGIVERDMRDGKALGVRGTPTWFINGRKEEGAIPEDKFRDYINDLLK